MPTKVHLKEPVKLRLSQPAKLMQDEHVEKAIHYLDTLVKIQKAVNPGTGVNYDEVKDKLLQPFKDIVAETTTAKQRSKLMELNEPLKDAILRLKFQHAAKLIDCHPDEKKDLLAAQKKELGQFVKAIGEAKGELWDSLATNREWNRQKAINSMFLKGDWKNAQDAAMRQMQASPGDISATGKSPTDETILDNMHKFT